MYNIFLIWEFSQWRGLQWEMVISSQMQPRLALYLILVAWHGVCHIGAQCRSFYVEYIDEWEEKRTPKALLSNPDILGSSI